MAESMQPHTRDQGQRTPRGRELPHDLLAEKSLLGCLLIDGDSFDDIADLSVVKEDFHHPKYGYIFDVIKDLSASSKPIDYVTVCSRLSETGKLEETGGQSFVLNIIEDQASSANLYHYAKIVKDKSSVRDIVRNAMRVSERGLNFNGKAEDFIKEVEETFFNLTNDAKTQGMGKLNSYLKQNLKDLEDTSRKPGELSGVSSGYKDIDRKLLGLQPGQLIVLAARPAMGKTALALNMAIRSCKQSGLPIALFSLEMLGKELSQRILSSEAKVPSQRLRTKNFLDTDLRSIGNAVQSLSQLPIFINDRGDTSVVDIQSYCRKIKAEHGLGLVVIDYLQLLKPAGNNPSREQQISEMSRNLKGMAKELECPVICLSQLNRGVESRPDKRPNTSDLRESGAIEQDADIVMMIYRDEYYNPDTKEPGIAEIIINKNRAGETGTVKLTFIGASTSFEPVAQDGENDRH